MNEAVEIISSVGFPIACVVFLFYYIKTLNTQHKEESKEFAQALNNNTIVLQKLCDKLENLERS